MQDASYASMASNLGMLHARGTAAPDRTGNRHGGLGISPYNAYQASDGHVVINAPGDQHFRAILQVIDRLDLQDDPRLTTRSARVANMLLVDEIVEAWTRRHPRNEIAGKLAAASVPCAPVRTLSEVIVDENMHERGVCSGSIIPNWAGWCCLTARFVSKACRSVRCSQALRWVG